MDEVYESLQRFQQHLETFNDKLKASFEDLNRHHEKVNSHWHDSMRKEYDARWKGLEEKMMQYVTVDGTTYTDILLHKVSIIRKYLYGY